VGVQLASFTRPSPPEIFRADHPFVFLLRDNQTGSILFMGRLVHPKGARDAVETHPVAPRSRYVPLSPERGTNPRHGYILN